MVASWLGRRVPGGGQGPEELRVMASSCSQETSPGRAQAAGLSSMLGGGGGVPRPLPARQRPVGAWRRPSSCSGRRSPSTPLADLCGRPGGSPCSRRLLRGACHNRHTLPGDKAPGWQGQAAIGSWQSRKPRGPSRRTPSRASVPARNEPCSPSFQRRLLGTYTLLGLLFLPTLSLPVSMATPPNSRFQAAMTSPFPFLPPRPGGTAALGWARASQRLQPDPRPLGHSWRALGPSSAASSSRPLERL